MRSYVLQAGRCQWRATLRHVRQQQSRIHRSECSALACEPVHSRTVEWLSTAATALQQRHSQRRRLFDRSRPLHHCGQACSAVRANSRHTQRRSGVERASCPVCTAPPAGRFLGVKHMPLHSRAAPRTQRTRTARGRCHGMRRQALSAARLGGGSQSFVPSRNRQLAACHDAALRIGSSARPRPPWRNKMRRMQMQATRQATERACCRQRSGNGQQRARHHASRSGSRAAAR